MTRAERAIEYAYRRTERIALLLDGDGPCTLEQMTLANDEATAACDVIERQDRKENPNQKELL